jgi:hypothetical protein
MTDPNETAPEEIEPEETEPEAIQEEDEPVEEDWKRRVLCSDGNCIGVIGPDGRCKECGKPYEGELPTGTAAPAEPQAGEGGAEGEAPEDEGSAPDDAEEGGPETPADTDDEWRNRRLCSDGNCIGVIGPDGRCKECGKPYEDD